MARPQVASQAKRAVPATGVEARAAMARPADSHAEWLQQARMVRDEGLHLLHERFKKDLDSAAQLLGNRDAEALASAAEYASKLTADYLADSERFFASLNAPGPQRPQRTRRKR